MNQTASFASFDRQLFSLVAALTALFVSPVFAADNPATAVDTNQPPVVKVPDGFRYEVLSETTLPEPMNLCFAPDGRLWITGRDGHLWTMNTQTKAYSLVGKLKVDKTDDRGLHGLALHPDFPKNGQLFVFYNPPQLETNKPRSRISRLTVSQRGRGELQPESEKVLLEFPLTKGGQHTGGGLAYHPKDKKLYATTGDNNRIVDLPKYYADPENQAQNLNDLRGKTLRLNLDGSIPKDNPYYNQPGKRGEIFTRGHRQAWNIRVDEKTGNLYLAENGGDRELDFEEVNLLKPGGNYGWPRVYNDNIDMYAPTNRLDGFVKPWFSYARLTGGSSTCALFYRGTKGQYFFPPEFRDVMFYADYNRKSVRVLRVDAKTNTPLKSEPFALSFAGGPIAMQHGPDGALYLVEYGGWFKGSRFDRISRIVYEGKL